MNQKNIIFLFLLYFIINAYGALIEDGGEEELEFSSENKFNEMVKTASYTAAVKTLPTKYITKSVTSATPSPTILPSKETTITIPFYNTIRKFLPVTTVLPNDVDEVFATCLYKNELNYEKKRELLDLPYVCYEDECYHEYNTVFNETYRDQYGYTFTTLECKIFTSKENDPTPTESINVLTTPICIPTYFTSEEYYLVSSTETEIPNETDSNRFAWYTTSVYSLSGIFTYSYSTVCQTKTKSSATPTITEASTPVTVVSTTEYPASSIISGTKEIGTRKVLNYSVPKSIKEIALKCTEQTKYTKYNPAYHTKTIPTTRITSKILTKTIPSSSSNNSIKTITATKSIPNTTMNFDSSSSSSSSSNKIERRAYDNLGWGITNYCENESSCWGKYTDVYEYQYPNVYTAISRSCRIYTPEATPTRTDENVPITSFCKPTMTFSTYRINSVTKIDYSTIYDGPEKTRIRVEYLTKADKTSYYTNNCYTTFRTFPTPPPVITTTPSPSISSTKCIPNISTVTEKEKVTVTEKRKVTVTVEVYE